MLRAKTERRESALFYAGEDIKKPYTTHVNFIVAALLVLLILGFTNLYSATSGSSQYFYSQLRNLIVTIPAFILFGWFIPVRRVFSATYWVFGVVCLLLAGVLINGRIAGGAQRWISIGPVGFQPSEFAKLTTVLVVARYFSGNRQSQPYGFMELWPVVLMVGAIFGLIFLQPDFGTAGLCLLIACVQIFFIRIDMRLIIGLLVSLPFVGVILWNFLLMDYQKQRVINLFNPNIDPSGSSYNSFQSLIAVGSGGFLGKGFMQGTQAQLKFLPERHTDFVFSVFAEEHGFLLSALVFIIFSIISYIALDIARHARETYASLLAIGIAAFIFLEFAINTSMVLGIFPVVGIPLPFFSHGSSVLLTICISLGLLVSINRNTQSRMKS